MDINGRETNDDKPNRSQNSNLGDTEFTERARCTSCEDVYRHKPDATTVVCPYCGKTVEPSLGAPL